MSDWTCWWLGRSLGAGILVALLVYGHPVWATLYALLWLCEAYDPS